MNDELEKRSEEIARAFNGMPKDGINLIKQTCRDQKIEPEKQIALFFKAQKNNLNLEAVGDYLSGPEAENVKVLTEFSKQFDLKGQSFTSGMRTFLESFNLPGEGQKVERLMASYGKTFIESNPNGPIANEDASFMLAAATMILHTSLHNPNVKEKMSVEQLKGILKDTNNRANFDEKFLEELHDDVKNNKFKFSFSKTTPGIELESANLASDPTFKNIGKFIGSPNTKIKDALPNLQDKDVTASVSKPKSWLNKLTGYKGTVTIENGKAGKATVQVYEPNLVSKLFYKDKPSIIVQPALGDKGLPNPESVKLAGQFAANFKVPVKSVSATYDYEKQDLEKAYKQAKEPLKQNIKERPKGMRFHASKLQEALKEEGRKIATEKLEKGAMKEVTKRPNGIGLSKPLDLETIKNDLDDTKKKTTTPQKQSTSWRKAIPNKDLPGRS